MAKQKIVIKVTMENAKSRSKALTIVAGLHGVISTQIDGETVVVVGEGLDPAALTVMLRKKMGSCMPFGKMGFAALVNVSAVEEKKEEKKEEKNEEKKVEKKEEPVIWPPPVYIYETRDSCHDPCSIM